MPKVSVLIPSFNHAPFLNACLDGVFGQTYGDLEVVLVDDGSKDQSVAIAREYAAREPRLQVHVNEHNLGTYGTQQRALEMSQGEFVAILNSDDLWAPTKLESQVAALEAQRDARFCYTLGWKVDENGRVDESEDVHADWPRSTSHELLPWLLHENRVLASSVLLRRDIVRFESSLRYSGDWVALLRPAEAAPAALVPERLNFWRMHSHNTFVRSARQVLEEIRVREAILATRWSRLPALEIRRGQGRNALNLAALEILRGNRNPAIRHALTALRLSPERRVPLRRLAAVLLPKSRERLWPGDTTSFDGVPPSQNPLAL